MKALAAGWDEVALFGVHGGEAPRERLDRWGVLPFLSWGTHTYSIVGFERDFCLLRTSGGSELRQQRHRANFDAAVVWWLHLAIQELTVRAEPTTARPEVAAQGAALYLAGRADR